MGWIDNALGTQANSVMVGARRAELLATNLANADTPGYRARDIDFRAVLADAEAGINRGLVRTRAGHISTGMPATSHMIERQVRTGSEDGNTVSKEVEQAAFTENSIRYLASLRFLNGSVQGIMKALKGE